MSDQEAVVQTEEAKAQMQVTIWDAPDNQHMSRAGIKTYAQHLEDLRADFAKANIVAWVQTDKETGDIALFRKA